MDVETGRLWSWKYGSKETVSHRRVFDCLKAALRLQKGQVLSYYNDLSVFSLFDGKGIVGHCLNYEHAIVAPSSLKENTAFYNQVWSFEEKPSRMAIISRQPVVWVDSNEYGWEIKLTRAFGEALRNPAVMEYSDDGRKWMGNTEGLTGISIIK